VARVDICRDCALFVERASRDDDCVELSSVAAAITNSQTTPRSSLAKDTIHGFPGLEYMTWIGTARLSARDTDA